MILAIHIDDVKKRFKFQFLCEIKSIMVLLLGDSTKKIQDLEDIWVNCNGSTNAERLGQLYGIDYI